jgi:hypothetical protein
MAVSVVWSHNEQHWSLTHTATGKVVVMNFSWWERGDILALIIHNVVWRRELRPPI